MTHSTRRHPSALLMRLLGGKTDRDVIRQVLAEPRIRNARRLIREADRLLAEELAAIEGEKGEVAEDEGD